MEINSCQLKERTQQSLNSHCRGNEERQVYPGLEETPGSLPKQTGLGLALSADLIAPDSPSETDSCLPHSSFSFKSSRGRRAPPRTSLCFLPSLSPTVPHHSVQASRPAPMSHTPAFLLPSIAHLPSAPCFLLLDRQLV